MMTALAACAAAAHVAAQDAIVQDTTTEDAAPLFPAGAGAPIPCMEEDPGFVMPTTGVAFTLPPDPGAEAGAECADFVPPPVRPPAPSLFRMVALPIGNNAPSRKWEDARLSAVTDHAGPWDELLDQAGQGSVHDPVGMVNRWVNWHVTYREDPVADEWATALTTLKRGYGDCEDFALAKMGLLLELGISSDDMYFVLLRDRRQVQHAVLAVNRGGRLYVLDNRTDKVLPADAIVDYTPILSFSGSFAWTYGVLSG